MRVLIFAAAVIAGALVQYAVMVLSTRSQRRGRRQAERALIAAEDALEKIEDKADLYRDIDPLAAEVRVILRAYRAYRAARAGRNTP